MHTDRYLRSGVNVTRRLQSVVMVAAVLFSSSSALADDWAVLFDGKSLDGWTPFRDTTQFALTEGVIVGTSSADTQFLHTVEKYGDFELQLEVKLHDTDLNSGVQIRTQLMRTRDDGQVRPRLHGPQVDIWKVSWTKRPHLQPGQWRMDHAERRLDPSRSHEERRVEQTAGLGPSVLAFKPGSTANMSAMSPTKKLSQSTRQA